MRRRVDATTPRMVAHGSACRHPPIRVICGGRRTRPGAAVPYWPEPTEQPAEGGDPRADAAGKADLWPRILGFLDRLRAR